MENVIVLSGLTRKRAETAGEIVRMNREVERLERDLACLDRTIRIFDPSAAPDTIRPVTKRRYPEERKFGHGEFTRSILTILRESPEPLSAKEIAMRLSEARGLDTGTSALQAMIDRVRGMLARQKARGAVACVRVKGEAVCWRVG